MQLKHRIKKLEQHPTLVNMQNPDDKTAVIWLETLTVDELLFLRDCRLDDDFKTNNLSEWNRLEKNYDEFKKQIRKIRR